MAITKIGTPQIGSANNGGNVTLTFDVAPQEGDLVILFGGHSDNNGSGTPGPVTAGYTEIIKEIGNDVAVGAWYKFMGATPDTTVTGSGDGVAQHGTAYAAVVRRGVDPAVLDATAQQTGQASGTSTGPDPPSITTQTADAEVFAFGAASGVDPNNDVATISGYSDFVYAQGVDTIGFGLAVASKAVASPGAENPGTFANWQTTGFFHNGLTVAIRETQPEPIIYTQTDTAADSGINAGCSGATLAATAEAVEIVEGGTAGSTETTFDLGATNTEAIAMFQTDVTTGEPTGTTWQAGDYVVRVNITTAQNDITWEETWICERTSGGTFNEIASLTAQAQSVSAGGVFTQTVNRGTDFSPADADSTLYIVLVFKNANLHTSRTVGITPSEDIDTPIVAGAVTPNIDVAHIASTASIFAPALTYAQNVVAATIASTALLFAPTVISTQAITGAHIASGAQVFAPTVAPGATQVQGAHIASTSALFAPTVAPGAVTVEGAHVASTAALFAPTVEQGVQQVIGAHIASSASLFAPTVAAGAVAVQGAHIATTASLFAPSVQPGAVAVTGAHISTTASLFAPTVTQGAQQITGVHISTTASLFAPTVTAEAPLPAAREPIGIGIEMELDGQGNGWTDMTPDVLLRLGADGGRGIRGSSPRDRVAQTGMCNFAMNNAASNSASLTGYYSPGHANRRDGFKIGTGVRASVVIDGEQIILWTGRITNIEPSTGQYLDKVTEVECRDYMDQAARHRLSGLAVAQDITEHAAFAAMIAAVSSQPRALEIHDGPDTYSFAHDLIRDEETFALTEMQRLALSSLALVWPRGNGTLVYEPRNLNRALPGDPAIELTEADLRNTNRPSVQDLEDERINLVQTVIAPRREDGSVGAEVVMYRAVQPILFAGAVATQQFRGLFTDAGQRAFRAGGINMVTPASGTDYVFNTAADGSGTDVTGQVDVSATFSGNSVLFAVTNNSGATAYATTLQVRGVGVLAQEKVAFEDSDTDAITTRGENALSIEMPYQSDPDVAREAAQWMLYVLEQDKRRPTSIPLMLDPGDLERAALIANREISDVFTFSESMTAFSGVEEFFINAIDFEARPDGTVWLYWTPARADSTNFWQLEVVGSSELGQTTRLGFGFIVGHTDVEHADSHSDSAHADAAHDDTHTDTAHGDAAHADGGHSDTHSDTAHVDTHSDTSHVDSAHVDSAHGDASHNDSHSDTAHGDISHQDVAHTDFHVDGSHSDESTGHTDTHGDTHADTHSDHDDIPNPPHFDSHNDTHNDSHDDVTEPHIDEPHGDEHDDVAHADSHTDNAHSDSHGDTAHNDAAHDDTAHGDTHGDTHSDTTHVDAHGDDAHGDAGHSDTAHVDSHTDTAHDDTEHADGHEDTAHGDANLWWLLLLLGQMVMGGLV